MKGLNTHLVTCQALIAYMIAHMSYIVSTY